MRLKEKDKIFDILFATLMFSMPLSMAFPNILLIILILLFFLKKNKVEVLNSYIKLSILFVFYIVIKAIFFSSFFENISLYKHLFTFLILSVLTLGLQNTSLVKKAYIFGVVIAVVYSLFQTGIYYFNHHTLPFGNSNQIQQVLLIHRPYFGIICLLAIILINGIYVNLTSKLQRRVSIIICFILVGFVYLIVARLALFLILIYFIYKIFQKAKASKRKVLMSVSGLILIFCSLFFLNNNIKNRLHLKGSFSETIKEVKNQEPRFVIWACFKKAIIKSDFNTFFGYTNLKQIKETLNNCYGKTIENKSKRAYYLETEFNTHNQFFDFFLQGGIISLLLFIGVLILGFLLSEKNFNAFFILTSFILFLLIENLFHRQIGVYLIGIFIPLFQEKRLKWKREK